MNILFPAHPLQPKKQVDEHFADEAVAAKEAGFGVCRVDLEAILGGDTRFYGVPEHVRPEFENRRQIADVLYRGWLMKPEHYTRLDLKLDRRLVTGPRSYEIAYNLPEWYPLFAEDVTPRTHVVPGREFDLDEVAERVRRDLSHNLTREQLARRDAIYAWQRETGTMVIQNMTEFLELPTKQPAMLKDYLKSAKHRWHDACYIPDVGDHEDLKRVTRNFLDAQGENLTGGLCFRKFVAGKQIGIHSKTRQPLFNEWRAFLSHGRVFYLCPYWGEGDYGSVARPKPTDIEWLCYGLSDLPFVAVDLAQRDVPVGADRAALRCGAPGAREWVIYEVNDGGAAGIPEGGNTRNFYKALAKEFV